MEKNCSKPPTSDDYRPTSMGCSPGQMGCLVENGMLTTLFDPWKMDVQQGKLELSGMFHVFPTHRCIDVYHAFHRPKGR